MSFVDRVAKVAVFPRNWAILGGLPRVILGSRGLRDFGLFLRLVAGFWAIFLKAVLSIKKISLMRNI